MAIKVYPDADSFENGVDTIDKSSNTELRYWVFGTEFRAEVRQALVPYIPRPFYDGLRYRSLRTRQIGPDFWEATASYADKDGDRGNEKVPFGGSRWSFSTHGGSVHITHGFDERKFDIGTNKGPSHGGAINVIDGRPEGTDVITPALQFDKTFKFPNAVVTDAYIKACALLTGSRNLAPIFSHDSGELLLEGVTGHGSSDGDPELTFSFVSDPDAEFQFNGVTIQKKGHDHFWIQSIEESDDDAKLLKSAPVACYLNEKYRKKDWAPLRIDPPPSAPM